MDGLNSSVITGKCSGCTAYRKECERLRGVIRWLYADLKAIHGTAMTAMDTARLQPEADGAPRRPKEDKRHG